MRIRDINEQLEKYVEKQLQKSRLPPNSGDLTRMFLHERISKLKLWAKFLSDRNNAIDDGNVSSNIRVKQYENHLGNLIVQFEHVDSVNDDCRYLMLPIALENIVEKHKTFQVVFYADESLTAESNCLTVKFIKAIKDESLS